MMQIKPLRENERSIDNWISFLRNIGSIDGTIHLFISGNNTNIELFLSCPSTHVQFIQNMFYANYTDSELNIIETSPPKANEYITFSSKSIIRTEQDYISNGAYMSPFHDLLSLFNTVDIHSKLTIQLSLRLQNKSSLVQKA